MQKLRSWLSAGILAIGLPALAPPVQAEELWLNMVAATSTEGTPPMALFAKKNWSVMGVTFQSGTWQSGKSTRYSKLHLFADREFVLGGVEIKGCGNFQDDILLFVNFDERVLRIESKSKSLVRHLIQASPPKARSVTLNFQRTVGVCLKAVTFLDAKGNPYEIRVPRVVPAKAVASSTLNPVDAYDVMNLFDSRYESGWAAKGKSSGEKLYFTFEQPQTVTRLKVWNGYQRSDEHCYENVRVKTFEVEGEGGYKATLEVKDVMGSKDIDLPRPFTGKTLRLTMKDTYKGKTYPDLVITELRFFDGQEWFTLDPFPRIQQTAEKNRASFKNAGLEAALNTSLMVSNLTIAPPEQRQDSSLFSYSSRFLFRPDGSFYYEGAEEEEDPEGRRKRVHALGNYNVVAASANQMDIRIFGLFQHRSWQDQASGDCNGCGRDCNKTPSQKGADSPGNDKVEVQEGQQIFQEFLRFVRKSNAEGKAVVTVESTGKKQFLISKELKNRLELNIED